ncbi:MAG TPA: hypothetical protein VFU71_06540, partial [Burkholderiaceae bacterium]|nr:hypothetical protein [Burkholderiaceae bacterium]
RVWPGMVVTDDSVVQAVGDARRAIGDKHHRAIQTVPRRGYRLVADAAPAAGSAEAPLARPMPARQRFRSPALALLSGVVFALGAAVWWSWPTRASGPAEHLSRPPLAVLAFRDEGVAPADAGLGQSIAEDLIADLARSVGAPVVSARSSFQLDITKLGVREVAQRLQVHYLVDGSVRREGEQLRIRTQLVDADAGRVVWTRDDGIGIAELPAVRAALIERLASTLGTSVWRVEKQRVLARSTSSLDAYTLTARAYAAKHRVTPEDHRAGRAAVEQALRIDPEYAFAWAVLGYLNAVDAVVGITGEWSPARGNEVMAQIDRGLQLDPGLALGYQARAFWLSATGRAADGLAAAEASVKLAPGDADNLVLLGFSQLMNGQAEKARASLDKALPLYPVRSAHASSVDTLIRWAVRDYAAALSSASYCVERTPGHLGCRVSRAVALTEMGHVDEARAEAAALRARAPGYDPVALSRSFYRDVPELLARRLRVLHDLGFGNGS